MSSYDALLRFMIMVGDLFRMLYEIISRIQANKYEVHGKLGDAKVGGLMLKYQLNFNQLENELCIWRGNY